MSGILQQAQATAGPSASSTPNGAKRLSATLLVPTLNEREGLEVVLPQIDPGWVDDILFVDGGSTDGTLEVIRRWGHGRLLVQTRPGLSNAYLEALARIASDIVVTFSPDGNSLPEAIPALVEKMRQGYDLVIASRYLPGAGSQDDDPVTAFGNWIFTRVINLLFGGRYTDSLVILRAYRRGLIEDLGLVGQTRKFEPEPLLSIRCAVHKKRVAEIPAKEPRRIGGIRKMNPLVNGWAIVVLIVREWFRTFRRKKRMSTTSTLRSLTQEEIRLYKENGYLVVNDLFSSEECDQILATCKARTDEKFSAILNLDRQVPAVREVMKSPKIVHIIETLQAERAQTVHLLDQLVKQMPEGVYLKSMSQKGNQVRVFGYAQSNARVSTLMRNVESSPWLEKPELVEVKAATVDRRRVSDFNLYFTLKRPVIEAPKDAGKAPAKPAAKKG